jgi:predicted LPLAT superfamily acyltransferase
MASEPAEPGDKPAPTLAEWTTRRERGSVLLLKIMTFISLRTGRTAGRFILYFIAAYFFAFAPEARRHSRIYLRRALGREPKARDRFLQVLTFATTIHDRVYLVNGQYDLFDISIEGEALVQEFLKSGQGAFLMGAHLGSFEVTRAVGLRRPGLRVTMAMYEETANKVHARLAAINPAAKLDVITLGRVDAMLKIHEHVDQGAFVGVLGDRTFGEEPGQVVSFLGAPARLPIGAMRAAATLRRPVVFMVGLYRGGNRYQVIFETLADFSAIPAGGRNAALRDAVARYAQLLEKYCRSDPYNWFNFYDFWAGTDAAATVAEH